jgi:hypothetical protein
MRLCNYLKILSALIVPAFIFICSSCNSVRQTTDFPNVYSIHQEKFEYRLRAKNALTHSKRVSNQAITDSLSLPNFSKSRAVAGFSEKDGSHKPDSGSIIQLLSHQAAQPLPGNNQPALTASLHFIPFPSKHTSRPLPVKSTGLQAVDTMSHEITLLLQTNLNNESSLDSTRQKRRETYANISLVTGVLSIVSIFVAPIVIIPLAIAAIVFGAMGLKSARRKRAHTGMIIGIIVLAALTLLVVAYTGALSSL